MRKKILVIDDEKPTLKIFRLLLEAFGYDVITAENGQEGLEVFKAERPDIILTDIKMPIMDGIEVLKNIKKINPYAEVVVITGHGDMELAIQSLNLDATDFINKPVQRNVLEKALWRAEERLVISQREESQITVSQTDEGSRIHIRGNVSALTVPHLQETFATASKTKNKRIYVVFEKSVSINGAGISALAELLKECKDNGFSVKLTGLSSNFQTVFKMVGISKLADVVTNETTGSNATH